MIKFDKALALLEAKGITTYRIRQDKIIAQGTLTSLNNNTPVSTTTIDRLCQLLDCQPGDLMEYVPDEE